MGLDGATWSISARRGGEFHLVQRWSPQDAVRGIGEVMFELAGLDVERLY